jgi:hypothetical protein
MREVKLKTTILWLNAMLFIAYGLGFALIPETLGQLLVGDAPDTTSAVIDMRATYGGMTIGLGIVFALLAAREEFVSVGLKGVIAVMALMAGTRLLGIVVDGQHNSVMTLYLIAEVLMALVATWALRKEPG